MAPANCPARGEEQGGPRVALRDCIELAAVIADGARGSSGGGSGSRLSTSGSAGASRALPIDAALLVLVSNASHDLSVISGQAVADPPEAQSDQDKGEGEEDRCLVSL